jgi:putative ATP-binding cassette transporter
MPTAPKPALTGRDLARSVWRLVRIYWTSADWKIGALLLCVAVALEFGTVYANVLVSDAQRDTFDALSARDASAFATSIGLAAGSMLLSVAVAAYRVYMRQILEIRWRRGLTGDYLTRWIGPQAYCQAELHRSELDNPDQRIAEDIRDFVASALGLSLSLLSAVATLLSFGGLLFHLSKGWAIPVRGETLEIPGLMLWVAIAFALLSMWLTHTVGRKLVPINFQRIKREADFRYGLVRFRDGVEAVGMTHGEAVERVGAAARFQRIFDNWLELVRAERNLNVLTESLGQANSIVPLVIAAAPYFAGVLTLGAVAQTRFAYGQVAGGLGWFVNAYREIARWRANIERLTTFADAMGATQREVAAGGVETVEGDVGRIHVAGVRIDAPPGHAAVVVEKAQFVAGERVAIQGGSDRDRTTLVRALAGIWPFGTGRVVRPSRERLLIAAQRPYLPIGTLRSAVSYPSGAGTFSDADIREALAAFGLGSLADRLDEEEPWDQKLSNQEQQRLSMARVLLHRPAWVVLDDATSSLDEASERAIHALLAERLAESGFVVFGERTSGSIWQRKFRIEPRDGGPAVLRAA